MIGRKDFIFTVGYEGNAAVVDGALKKRYGSLSTRQLAESKLYKQAICSAVYEQASGRDTAAELEDVLQRYNQSAERTLASVEELKRTFGVFEVPEGVAKVIVI